MESAWLDVLIPLGPNDIDVIRQQLIYTRKNIVGLRTIYIAGGADEVYPNKMFWELFLGGVAEEHRHGADASEYEMYFHFMLRYHPDKIAIRNLSWKNVHSISDSDKHYDFVSNHWYSRKSIM